MINESGQVDFAFLDKRQYILKQFYYSASA